MSNLRATLCLDRVTSEPHISEPHITLEADRAYLFVELDECLSLWTYDPERFRLLAETLRQAADQLEDARRALTEAGAAHA